MWTWPGCCVLGLCLGWWVAQSTATWRRGRTHYGNLKPQTSSTETTETTESTNSSQEWFTQQLDHFDPTDDTQWEQRYWVNTDYYCKGAPVFLFVTGEWEETGFSEELNEPWEISAKMNKALMFKLEHRFYGESQPTGGNLTVEDLQYLSSDQVLADLANFIAAMNRQHELPHGTKWVAFGCSYSATLAVWLRYKYPHLVYAAVASSALLLFKVNFPEYYNAMGEALMKFYGKITHNDTLGKMCLETFKQANKEVNDLIKTPEGINLTIENFGLDDVVEFDANQTFLEFSAGLFHTLFTVVSNAVQENSYDYMTETWGIERICDTLLNETLGGVVVRYSEIYKIIHSEADPKDNETNRQWFYQTCTELGIFPTSEDESSILGNYIQEKDYFNGCMIEFGERFTEEFIRRGVDRTVTRYGGLELDATRVIYVYGTLDPCFGLGLNHTRNPLSPVIVIEGASHCSDWRPPADHDSDALREARANISYTLNQWLKPTTLP